MQVDWDDANDSSIILRASSNRPNNHHKPHVSHYHDYNRLSRHVPKNKVSNDSSKHHHYNRMSRRRRHRHTDSLPVPHKSNEDILRQLKRRYGVEENEDSAFTDEENRGITLSGLRQRYESTASEST